MNITKRLLTTLGILTCLGLSVAPTPSFAQPKPAATQVPSQLTEEDITEFLTKIAGMAIRYVLVIAAIFIMLAGYIFITAAGNKQKVEQAKQMLLYTIIGILVVLGAYIAVNTVLRCFSGSSTTVCG